LRILFFIENLWTGGTQRRLSELISYLSRYTDFELLLVVTEKEIHFKNVLDSRIKIIVLHRIGLKHDPSIFFRFYSICKEFKPDIIHSWGVMTTFYAIPSKLFFRKPLLANIISDSNRRFKKFSLRSIFFKTDIHFSDLILSNSIAGLQAYEVNSSKTKVIYNGLRPERFVQDFDIKKIRKEIGVKSKYMVIMVASFSDYKDYDLFVNVAAEAKKLFPDLTFVAVGDGPEWERIRKRVDVENVTNIILMGHRENIEPYVAASDIGLMCTITEGISNSIIEYMALGKPVISTDTKGASKEIIIEGETGFCTERNTNSVIQKLTILLNNEELRVAMGANGKERIVKYFSFESFGNGFVSVYKDVTGNL